MSFFLNGLLMGLAYVAPIGAQNLFVINSAINQKISRSIITALIVVFFDITLALACFLGVGYVIEKITWISKFLLLFGSIIIIYIGIKLIIAKITDFENNLEKTSFIKIIISSCVVTWFNPQAIIDGTMIFGASISTLNTLQSREFMFGVFTASFSWFLGITLIVSIFKNIFNRKILNIINKICGIYLIYYGISLFYTFLIKYV